MDKSKKYFLLFVFFLLSALISVSVSTNPDMLMYREVFKDANVLIKNYAWDSLYVGLFEIGYVYFSWIFSSVLETDYEVFYFSAILVSLYCASKSQECKDYPLIYFGFFFALFYLTKINAQVRNLLAISFTIYALSLFRQHKIVLALIASLASILLHTSIIIFYLLISASVLVTSNIKLNIKILAFIISSLLLKYLIDLPYFQFAIEKFSGYEESNFSIMNNATLFGRISLSLLLACLVARYRETQLVVKIYSLTVIFSILLFFVFKDYLDIAVRILDNGLLLLPSLAIYYFERSQKNKSETLRSIFILSAIALFLSFSSSRLGFFEVSVLNIF